MKITTLPKLDTALALLEDAGIEFTVVCSGPEPECSPGQIPQAA